MCIYIQTYSVYVYIYMQTYSLCVCVCVLQTEKNRVFATSSTDGCASEWLHCLTCFCEPLLLLYRCHTILTNVQCHHFIFTESSTVAVCGWITNNTMIKHTIIHHPWRYAATFPQNHLLWLFVVGSHQTYKSALWIQSLMLGLELDHLMVL